MVQMFCDDSGTVILNGDDQVIRFAKRSNVDLASARLDLASIEEDVEQHLLDLFGINKNI